MAIEEHCPDFFGPEGQLVRTSGFDVEPDLRSSKMGGSVRACSSESIVCFPVHVELFFKGVGRVDHDDDRDVINEPGCTITNRCINDRRDAIVKGSVRYTIRGNPLGRST